MGKSYGANSSSNINWEFGVQKPLDTRSVVNKVKDLTDPETWKLENSTSTDYYTYKGMLVACKENNKIYMYKGDENNKETISDSNNWISISSVPTEKNKLIYSDGKDLYNDFLMNENFLVVDNHSDLESCKAGETTYPDLSLEWILFSCTQLSPEYGFGYSGTLYKHIAPSSKTSGYGFGNWQSKITDPSTITDGNLLRQPINSDDYNGYLNVTKSKQFKSTQVIGCNQGYTTGDWEGIALVNTNYAIPRSVITKDKKRYVRNSLYDLEGSSDNLYWCAWIYDDGSNIYSVYSKQSKISELGISSPYMSDYKVYYEDEFPEEESTIYLIKDNTTSTSRKKIIDTGNKLNIDSTKEAFGFIPVFNILTINSTGCDRVIGNNSVQGTIFAFTNIFSLTKEDILPVTEKGTATQTDGYGETNYGFYAGDWNVPGPGVSVVTSNIKSLKGYYMNISRTQVKNFIGKHLTVSKDDSDGGYYSGNKLVTYLSSLDTQKSEASTTYPLTQYIKTKDSFNAGIFKIEFSLVFGKTENSTNDWGNKFLTALEGTDPFTNVPINYVSSLTIDFNNNKFKIKQIGETETDWMDISLSRGKFDGTYNVENNIEETDTKFKFRVLNKSDFEYLKELGLPCVTTEDPVLIENTDGEILYEYTFDDIFKFFGESEKIQLMYQTLSYNYHCLAAKLQFGTKQILKIPTDEDGEQSVYNYDSISGTYVENKEDTPLGLFEGSKISYNDITKKLWYSNGSKIINISSNSGGSGVVEISTDDYKNIHEVLKTDDPNTIYRITDSDVNGLLYINGTPYVSKTYVDNAIAAALETTS